MEYYISQIIQGIANGSIYGLFGLSAMFIYRTNRVFNFANGEMATAAVFVIWLALARYHPILSVLFGILFAFMLGAGIESAVLKLLRDRPEGSTALVTIGLYGIINNTTLWFFGAEPYLFPSPFPKGVLNFQGVIFSYQDLGVLGCTLFLSILLYLLFRYTLIGIAFQAIAEDPITAKLKGIRVGVLVTLAWGLSVVVATLAAVLLSNALFLHPNLMLTVTLFGFSAAIIGGLQTSFGAIVGGIIVGVTESVAAILPWIGSGLKTVAVFVTLVLFLTVKPRGIFGRDEARKA